jgi:hypothetical protein
MVPTILSIRHICILLPSGILLIISLVLQSQNRSANLWFVCVGHSLFVIVDDDGSYGSTNHWTCYTTYYAGLAIRLISFILSSHHDGVGTEWTQGTPHVQHAMQRDEAERRLPRLPIFRYAEVFNTFAARAIALQSRP